MSERDRREEEPHGETERRREIDSRAGAQRGARGREEDEVLVNVRRRGTGESRPGRADEGDGDEGSARRDGGGSGGAGAGLYGSDIGANVARAATAEAIGTFVLVYTGTAVAVAAVLGRPAVGPPFDSLSVPLAFGLVLAALVAALGHVSGAHLNPAVTLGLAATRKFPWNLTPAYLGAQLGGAILAAIATWITLGGRAYSVAALAAPTPAADVGVLRGFVVEALITFILVFIVISVATDDRAPAAAAPLAVGFALAAGVFIGGPVTGGAVNPARALGPIIVAWENWSTAWLYILAPIAGGVLAAVLYDRFIGEADAPEGG